MNRSEKHQSHEDNLDYFLKSALILGENIEIIDIRLDHHVSATVGVVLVSEIIFRNLRVVRFHDTNLDRESFMKIVDKNMLLETIDFIESTADLRIQLMQDTIFDFSRHKNLKSLTL